MKKLKKYIILTIFIAMTAVLGFVGLKYYLSLPKDPKPIIEEMAKTYYENHIYSDKAKAYQDEEFENMMDELSRIGIEKTLFDITRFVDHNDKHLLMNSKESGIKCDFFKTKVKYYPKSPYSKTDYEFELEVSCEIEK